jgi:hypothetical protein
MASHGRFAMHRRLAALGVALVVVGLTAGAVFAAGKVIPTDGVFYACYDSGGNVKFIDYAATQNCPRAWTGPVAWNQRGLIGIHNVYFIGNEYGLNPDESGVSSILRVWMETGSPSEACLATMGEAYHAPSVDTLYCSSRFVTFDDSTQHWGVVLTLMLAGPLVDVEVNETMEPSWYSVNVYQEGALSYGDPMPCTMDGC